MVCPRLFAIVLSENRERYSAAEDAARVEYVGLWADDKAVPPWEWRHHKR
jgi:endonuclease YncB( thermonuclease family)